MKNRKPAERSTTIRQSSFALRLCVSVVKKIGSCPVILSVFVVFLLNVSASANFEWQPIYEHRSATNGAEFLAIRPFYSRYVNPETERWRTDYLWPLYTRKGFQDEKYGRLLFFGFSNDFSADNERYRNWILPFYFQGSNAEGDNYFALFPLGGKIEGFLGRDEIMFVLFPLYAKSHVNEVKTTSVLWPIYSNTKGDKVDRFRVFPFYGRSQLAGESDKKFVLWPIYNSVKYTHEANPGGGFMLFPLYGRVVRETGKNQWFIPPLFRFASGGGQRIVHAPWPFIQWADGPLYKRYYWPLYGKKVHGTLTQQYWAWPIIWNTKVQYTQHARHRRNIVPLFYSVSDVATKAHENYVEGDVLSKHWKLWPLMSWDRVDDHSQFRMLELWPLRNTLGVERNWAPFWTLYRRERAGEDVGHHFLWGLYQQAKGPERFEWSLLKGLAGYKKEGDHSQYRILFMWFGGGEDEP